MAFPNFSEDKSVDNQVRRFRDVEGLSTRRLDFGLWYLRHRKQFFLALVVVLIVTATATIGYSLYQFSSYLLVGMNQDQQNFLELTSGSSLITNKTNTGSNLSYSETRVFAGHDGKYDVIAAVTNSNARSIVRFSYYFTVNGQRVGGGSDFILPDDTKYLMALGYDLPSSAGPASLELENISLVRLDRHTISDWEQYRLERLNFVIENAKFTPGFESGLSDKVSLGELRFTIANRSAYGYQIVPLAILLKSGGQIVAVNRYLVGGFRSGEERAVQMSWPGKLPPIDQVDIMPDVNILDDSVYLKYSGL